MNNRHLLYLFFSVCPVTNCLQTGGTETIIHVTLHVFTHVLLNLDMLCFFSQQRIRVLAIACLVTYRGSML